MPPWDVDKRIGSWKNDLSLTSAEKALFLKWLAEGLPYRRRDIKLFNPQAEKSIKNPDYVMRLPEPVEVPATGFLPYQVFIFDPNFKEDKWIKEAELVRKPKVIHHLNVREIDQKYYQHVKILLNAAKSKKLHVVPIQSTRLLEWGFGTNYYRNYGKNKSKKIHDIEVYSKRLFGWGIGKTTYRNWGKRLGVKINKGALLALTIHYEPIGKKVIDSLTQVKLKFHSSRPKFSHLIVRMPNRKFIIPPHHSNYLVESRQKIKKNRLLTRVRSHMHLRGKASSISIIDPEGKTQEIFRLNSYNFNFQRGYKLKKPLMILKGSTLVCRNWFDNSAGNPVNPDPSKHVTYGLWTKDEMSVCVFYFIVSNLKKT